MVAGLTSGGWLHWDESSECVFCFTCVSTFKEKKLVILHVHKETTDCLNLVDCSIVSTVLVYLESFVNHKCAHLHDYD